MAVCYLRNGFWLTWTCQLNCSFCLELPRLELPNLYGSFSVATPSLSAEACLSVCVYVRKLNAVDMHISRIRM